MIKNKKATTRGSISEHYCPYAPSEDWNEVLLNKQGYSINWCFVNTLTKEAPTFWRTHKPLENAITEQIKKVCQ